jgi:hypothetical protein
MCMSEIPDDYADYVPGSHQASDAAVRGDAAPIEVRCDTASDCPIPPSRCNGYDLVYYTNPYCASGSCVWMRNTRSDCACSGGGCNYSSTVGPLPSEPPSAEEQQAWCASGLCGACTGCLEVCTCVARDTHLCEAYCSDAGSDGSVAEVECTDLDLSKCSPPRSSCIDANTMSYVAAISCVDGHCAWERKSIACPCAGGVCQSTTTAGGEWSDAG